MICAFFLVDLIGRKRSLSAGITIQLISMLYIAIFLLIDKDIGKVAQSASQKHAAMGAIVMIYFSGFGWALGWNSIQYLINSEIYPLRLRALGGSFAMTFHFANQYGNSKVCPNRVYSIYHVTNLFQGCATYVPRLDQRRHYVALRMRDWHRSCLGVLLPS